ncbi:MAG: histone deacetylase family protein [Planctomycetota bacterium]
MRTGLVTDPLFLRHLTGSGHPERPERLPAILEALEGLDLAPVAPRDASRAELEAAHDADYVTRLGERIAQGSGHLDADTVVSRDSYAAAVRAAGAALALGEAWLAGDVETGFACVRPPGHHACRGRAMGFCLFNNVAVLARFLHAAGKRVGIVDWDVHHGNGTQDIFWNDPEIGYCSVHQFPFYPGTGAAHETGAGNILNVPLPAGSGSAEYRTAFEKKILPWLNTRAPDVVLVSAGFDAHARDPLAEMQLSADDFKTFTRMLLDRPLLSVLEGGYDLEGLAASARAHVEVLVTETAT